MEYTTKYKLSKPTYDDDVDIQVLNKNFDIIDAKLQAVSVSDNTLHVDDNNYPLNFLPLTGGTVTGATEFTGKLTNNGKDVGKMFNGSATIKSILDWSKMKEVYGSEMSSTTTIYKGEQKTISYPKWCTYIENMGLIYFSPIGKDLYLTDDFTNYDEVAFNVLISETNNSLYYWKSKVLEYVFENQGYINVAELSGAYMSYHGFNQYGSKLASDVSTKKHLKYYMSKGWMIDVYGIKYDV